MENVQPGRTILVVLILISSSLWAMLIPIHAVDIEGSITADDTWSGYYNITGDIYIESGVKLTIAAGTTVEVMGDYGIYIANNATLDVRGNASSPVTIFTETAGGWTGINLNTSSSSAFLNYTHLYNGSRAINATHGGVLRMDGCMLKQNLIGIDGEDLDAQVENSVFEANLYPFIFIKVNGSVLDSTFFRNGGGMFWLYSQGKPRFENNVIIKSGIGGFSNAVEFSDTSVQFRNNSVNDTNGHALVLSHCDAFVHNNTLFNNGKTTGSAGVYVYANAWIDTSTIMDNNIYGNGNGIILDRNSGQPSSVLCKVMNNEIHHNVNSGVVILNYSDPEFENNSVHNNSWGIRANKANPVISNSSVIFNTLFDFLVEVSAGVTSLNTIYGNVSVTLPQVNQFLKVVWFKHITVRDKITLLPIPGAEVLLSTMANPNTVLHRLLTDASGQSKYIHVVERTVFNPVPVVNSPYRITAEDLGKPRVYVKNIIINYAVTGSSSLTIDLAPNFAPSAPTGISTLVAHEVYPRITWSASNDTNGDPVRYNLKIGTISGLANIVPVTNTPNTYFDVSVLLIYGTTYFVCINASDNRYANSTWSCQAMYVRNDLPSKPTIIADPPDGEIYTDTPINIKMTVPSSNDPIEISDYGETIRYSVDVKINDEVKMAYAMTYVIAGWVNFTIGALDFIKDDEINVTVTPYDGHSVDWNNSDTSGLFKHPGNGTPVSLILNVTNHVPEVNQTIPDIIMNEDRSDIIPLKFNDIFSDPDNDLLIFGYVAHPDFDLYYDPVKDQISITPGFNYYTGSVSPDILTISADDGSGGTVSFSFNVTVIEINDLPEIIVNEPQVAYQDKIHYINITLVDHADPPGTPFTLATNYTDWSFSNKINFVEHSGDNISLNFTPDNDDIGVYYLNISGSDGDDTVYKNIMVSVINVNDRPDKPIIISPVVVNGWVNRIYNTTDTLLFEATTFDPDLKWNDSLSYLWKSNISGLVLGDKNKFETKIAIGGHHEISVTVTDRYGLSNSTTFRFSTEVICPLCYELPQTVNVYPLNEMVIPSPTPSKLVTLKWQPMEHKYSGLFSYDLEYWTNDLSSKPKIISGINTTEHTLNLEVGNTYYWWVIPKLGGDGGVKGNSFSGKWAFSIELCRDCIEIPGVKLTIPGNGNTVNSGSIELRWAAVGKNPEYYYYRIYLDENPEPSTLIKDYLTETSFTVDNLKNNTEYYWNIVPVFDVVSGNSVNGPFSFTVKLGHTVKYGVKITPDNFDFEFEPEGEHRFSYTIENTGDNAETFTISVEPDAILEDRLSGDTGETVVILAPGEVHQLDFTLILDGLAEEDYRIRLKIETRDKDVFETPTINIKVEKEQEAPSLPTWLLIVVVILILLAVVGLFLLMRTRRGREEPEVEDEKSEAEPEKELENLEPTIPESEGLEGDLEPGHDDKPGDDPDGKRPQLPPDETEDPNNGQVDK